MPEPPKVLKSCGGFGTSLSVLLPSGRENFYLKVSLVLVGTSRVDAFQTIPSACLKLLRRCQAHSLRMRRLLCLLSTSLGLFRCFGNLFFREVLESSIFLSLQRRKGVRLLFGRVRTLAFGDPFSLFEITSAL